MSLAKKYANEGYEEMSWYTTRSFSKHGLTRAMKQEKKIRNRAGKRFEEQTDFSDYEE